MTYQQTLINTIPGRDIKQAPMDRAAWLRRYLADRAEFSWTDAYRKFAAELAQLEGE